MLRCVCRGPNNYSFQRLLTQFLVGRPQGTCFLRCFKYIKALRVDITLLPFPPSTLDSCIGQPAHREFVDFIPITIPIPE